MSDAVSERADLPAPAHDYIIVGAGSAGASLASRLSEDGRTRVLLLEAGAPSHPYSAIPMSFGLLIDHPGANWRYTSEPEEGTRNRRIPVPRGKLLGGSSAINGLVFVRGQPLDYDGWAQLGNRGWSFEDLLPIFRRMENYEHGADEYRAQGGPLHVCRSYDQSPLYDALFAAGSELGLPVDTDYNGADQEGIVRTQTTIRDGRRASVAACYLAPARERANLEIRTRALAESLVLDGRRCVGVRFRQDGRTVTATAGREVIVSAGAVASPQLLELSGIGRPEVLQPLGIAVRHPLAGVGENFRDHINGRVQWRITRRGVSWNDRMHGLPRRAVEVLRYALTRRGFFALPSAPLLAFLKSREGLASPDIQCHLVPFIIKDPRRRQLQPFPGMTIATYQLRPESLGSIHLRSHDPAAQPAIRFNFLSAEIDRRVMVAGIRWARRIGNAAALDGLRGEEFSPGREVESDDEILDFIRGNSETAYHPIGTCKMGGDPMAVVDERLRVHGLEGLRVADASIMPTMVSGNTNAASIMIGEKAADLLRQAAQPG